MAVKVADKFKQMNGQTYKLMDAVDVDYDGNGTSLKEKVDEALTKSGNVNEATNQQIDDAIANYGK